MIVKGFTLERGQAHATHLLRTDTNDHVHVQEVRGFVSGDLHGAFKEAEAISRGTKCEKYLFSCAFAPPNSANLSDAEFIAAADKTEQALGLAGQPRAVVFHEKDGKRHMHTVWSVIDAEQMKAIHLSHWKNTLRGVSRELHLELGIEMPKGLANKAERDPTNFTQQEWQQAQRLGQDPRWIKQIGQDAWRRSDNASSFQSALEDHSFFLAKGDRRGHVLVDALGGVHSVAQVVGIKAKEVRARLGDPAQLRSVQDVQREVGERLTQTMRRHIETRRASFEERARPVGEKKAEMAKVQREQRTLLELRQTTERESQARTAQASLPRGLRGLWERITGRYQERRGEIDRAAEVTRKRQDDERLALVNAQIDERRALQDQISAMRKRQAEQLLEMRRELARFMKVTRPTPEAQKPAPNHASTRRRGLDFER